MKDDDIRHKMFHQLDDVKKLMLSGRKIQILKWCKKGFTSAELVDRLDISIQAASSQMAALHRAGYLDRVDQVHPTGGSEFVYKCRV